MDRAFANRAHILREAVGHVWTVAAHWPLGLVPEMTPRFIGRRCGLAYSLGYVRAAPAALGLIGADTAQ
jgi:hypothetical protein